MSLIQYVVFCVLLTTSSAVDTPSIQIYLQKTGHHGQRLRLTNLTVSSNKFKKKSEIIVMIQDPTEMVAEPWVKNMARAYHKRKDNKYQVIIAEWTYEKKLWYCSVIKNVEYVGKMIAKQLINLSHIEKFNIDRYHLLCHSIGCQVTSFVAKFINLQLLRKPTRITALDAAGPGFNQKPPDRRLNKDDAEMVVGLHTDSHYYGFADPIGHVDFYPNGGLHSQPGCKKTFLDIYEKCSHHRSHEYWYEAVKTLNFEGTKCNSWENFENGSCKNNKILNFAGNRFSIKKADSGLYYTITNDKSPLLRRSKNNKLLGSDSSSSSVENPASQKTRNRFSLWSPPIKKFRDSSSLVQDKSDNPYFFETIENYVMNSLIPEDPPSYESTTLKEEPTVSPSLFGKFRSSVMDWISSAKTEPNDSDDEESDSPTTENSLVSYNPEQKSEHASNGIVLSPSANLETMGASPLKNMPITLPECSGQNDHCKTAIEPFKPTISLGNMQQVPNSPEVKNQLLPPYPVVPAYKIYGFNPQIHQKQNKLGTIYGAHHISIIHEKLTNPYNQQQHSGSILGTQHYPNSYGKIPDSYNPPTGTQYPANSYGKIYPSSIQQHPQTHHYIPNNVVLFPYTYSFQ